MNLVLQGAPLARDDLSEIAALTGANHIVTLGATAWRLTGVAEQDAIVPYCAQRGLDYAWAEVFCHICCVSLTYEQHCIC